MYNATVWIENMSRESNVTFQKGMSELFSKNNEKDGKEKKVTWDDLRKLCNGGITMDNRKMEGLDL